VVVQLENHDLFWHTFTIPELDVDMKVPVQATQQVTFQAPAGTYRFLCTIPGHEMLGMEGTLTVQ
jgi:plastocyanin